MGEALTPSEVLEHWGMARSGLKPGHVRGMCIRGELRGEIVCGDWSIRKEWADEYLAAREAESSQAFQARIKRDLQAKRDAQNGRLGKLRSEVEIVGDAIPIAEQCGIYFLIRKGQVVYVGRSVCVQMRLAQHIREKKFDAYAWVPCLSVDAEELERRYIRSLKPRLNKDQITKRERAAAQAEKAAARRRERQAGNDEADPS